MQQDATNQGEVALLAGTAACPTILFSPRAGVPRVDAPQTDGSMPAWSSSPEPFKSTRSAARKASMSLLRFMLKATTAMPMSAQKIRNSVILTH